MTFSRRLSRGLPTSTPPDCVLITPTSPAFTIAPRGCTSSSIAHGSLFGPKPSRPVPLLSRRFLFRPPCSRQGQLSNTCRKVPPPRLLPPPHTLFPARQMQLLPCHHSPKCRRSCRRSCPMVLGCPPCHTPWAIPSSPRSQVWSPCRQSRLPPLRPRLAPRSPNSAADTSWETRSRRGWIS